MNKTAWVHLRINQSQDKKLRDMEEKTGLVRSEVVRRLIDSAELAPTPMPVAQLDVPEKEAA